MPIKVYGEAVGRDEAVGLGMSENNTGGSKSQAGKKSGRPAGQQIDDYLLAKRVANEFGKPLAFQAGQFWAFDPRTGWTIATPQVFALAAKLKKRNPEHSIMPVLQNQLAIPTDDELEAVYWERTGDFWNPKWAALDLSAEQVLFADQIYNVVTGEAEHLGQRIVFGPMVSLPWGLEDGQEEPTCPEFETLVKAALPDVEIRRHFQEVASVILQPHEPFRGQLVLWGVPYSGKTTLATAIGCCPGGRRGISQVQEVELCRDKYISAALVGRFANVSDDSALTSRWVSFLKRYTSGSMVVEPKFHQPQTVTPTAKLISTTNEIQSLVDASGAGLDRLLAFRFAHALPKVAGTNSDKKMSVLYWSNRDRRAGILTWLMAGLERLRARGRFDLPQAWVDQMNEASEQADPIAAILTGSLVKDATGFVPSAEIMALFTGKETIRDIDRKIPVYLDRLFGAVKTVKKVDGVNTRGYSGVNCHT